MMTAAIRESRENVIQIKPSCRLANRMLQYLVARALQQSAPGTAVRGHDLVEFGQVDRAPPADYSGYTEHRFSGHVIPFRKLAKLLNSQSGVLVRLEWMCLRMEYIRDRLALARSLFPIDPALKTGFDAGHLVIAVRLGDTVMPGAHPNYPLLPIDWYRHLIAQSGLAPVFVGEFGDDAYSQALRARFPAARFVYNENPLDDFNILRTSANVVVNAGTFSWLAAWLSTSAQQIVMPVIGQFNPADRPDIDMLPIFDRRYRFHRFPREQWQPTPERIAAKVSQPAEFSPIASPRLYRSKVTLALALARRLPDGVSLMRDLRASQAQRAPALPAQVQFPRPIRPFGVDLPS